MFFYHSKSGINESFDGHFGPVTGLSSHQVVGPIDFSQLFLTSSFDWTVKLWNLKVNKWPLKKQLNIIILLFC